MGGAPPGPPPCWVPVISRSLREDEHLGAVGLDHMDLVGPVGGACSPAPPSSPDASRSRPRELGQRVARDRRAAAAGPAVVVIIVCEERRGFIHGCEFSGDPWGRPERLLWIC